MQRSKAGKTELLITRRYFYAWTTWLSRSRWSGNLPYRWMTFYDDDDDAAGAALIRQRDCDRHWSNLLSNKMQAWKILESILITFFVNSWSGLERFEQVRTPASDQYQCIELTRPGSLLTQRTEEKSMIFRICLSTDSYDETFHFLNENSFKTSFTIVNFCDILNNLNLMCVVYKSTMIWTTKLEACPKQPSIFWSYLREMWKEQSIETTKFIDLIFRTFNISLKETQKIEVAYAIWRGLKEQRGMTRAGIGMTWGLP